MKNTLQPYFRFLLLAVLCLPAFSRDTLAQDSQEGMRVMKIPLELKPEQLVPGAKAFITLQNPAMPVACTGAGNESVGGFLQCADQTNAILKTDRNEWWNCCAPPGWQPSEAYEYNFPAIATTYPCVAGATVDQLILTITINSVSFNLGSPYACCEDYLEGVYGNLYDNCPPGTDCLVAGDGVVNNGNPGTGDCAPNGDHLVYDGATNSFPMGLPYTATTTCMAALISTSDNFGVDIVPSFFYQDAAANGCNCPTDLISQGLVSIDYDIEVEYVFCSNSLPAGCFPAAFTAIGPLCESAAPVVLPTTSNNGISGTWNPATINPAGQGGSTVTATFTPNPGQCVGGTAEMEVAITAATVPTFTQIGPLCESGPPVPLPGTSTNGVTGTWDVGANFNPVGQGGNTVTITFTPAAGQCASTQTMNIVVNNAATPAFTQIGPLCESDPPVPLPGTSTNGVTGTWDVGANFNPAGQGGNTVTITFTPAAGQCATTQTMDIVVNNATTPAFTQIGPLCESDPPVPLPGTSTNGVTGTWDVGANFNPAGQGGNTVTITFTPAAGQCATTQTMNIVVNNAATPTFAQIGPLCEIGPPVPLPGTSTNGVTGTWDVGANFNPAGQGGNLVTITFTPAAGQCATTQTMDILVNQAMQPLFSPVGPLCESDPPAPLPTISLNGIIGTWDVGPSFNPAGQGGNLVTITFTPGAGQCATSATMNILVNQAVQPLFSPVGPLCENALPVPLPLVSLNGIVGSWNVGPNFDPAGQGGNDVTITFTPAPGQCASQTNLTISVLDETLPTFLPIGPFCENAGPFVLPSQSLEGISGSWDIGATFDPSGLGGTSPNLTFTPDAGQCASSLTLPVSVNSLPQNTVMNVECNAGLMDYFVEFQTDGDDVSSTAGTVTANGGGNFTIGNIPEGTDITVTVTNTSTGCISTFDVNSPSCNCPPIAPPSGNDVEICEGEAVPALTAMAGPGFEVDWYNAATGGLLLLGNSTSYTPPGAGIYFAEAVDPNSNCTSNTRTAIQLTILPVDTTFAQGSTCNVLEVGVDTMVFSTATCDSVVITTTTLIPASEFFQNATSCDPADVGLDTLILTNQLGCDSLVITQTTLSAADTSFASATTCDPILVGVDTTIFATATCDSVVITTTTLLPPDETFLNNTSCNPAEVGLDTLVLSNQAGCDSLVITTTTLLPPDETFLNSTSCNPAEVGLDTLVLSNQAGCDSLVITETTLEPLPPTFAQAATCDPLLVGTDTTIFSSMGCDSMVITTTALLPGDEVFLFASSCDPAGTGVDTLVLMNQNGCDSLVITTTTLSAADTTFATATTCDPASVGIDTTIFATATCDSVVITSTTLLPGDVTLLQDVSCDPAAVGLDTLVLQNQAGCDSLVITETVFEGIPPTFVPATTCDPAMAGVDTLVFSSMGCDSMVITTTTLLPGDEVFLFASSCDPAGAGVDTLVLMNQNGCDSLVITTTTLSPADTTFVPATTCDPAQAGVDTVVFATATCDSVVITTTVLLPSDQIFLNATTCDPAAVGVDTLFLINQNGCDSLVVISTGLLASSEVTLQATTCIPAEAGLDTVVLINQAGCDSLVITNTVLAGGITNVEISTIDPDCNEPFGSISIENVEGGTAPYLYSIDGGQQFSTSPLFDQLGEGGYPILVEDADGCIFEISGQLSAGAVPQIFIDPDQVDLNLGESYFIQPVLTIPDSFLVSVQWSPSDFLDCADCLSATATPLESTTYTVSIVDENGCQASAAIAFFVNEKIKVYLPSVFSPNGDGINDIFTVQGDGKLIAQVDELLIFDRWGDSVFENFNFSANDFSSGWDGARKGKAMHQGVYVYLATVTLVNGEQVMLEGEVVLIR